MTKGLKPGTCLLLLSLLLLACKREASMLSYKMKNIATDSVVIVNSMTGQPLVSDTVWVGYNQEVTIAVAEEGTEHVITYKETGDTLRNFSRLEVYRIHAYRSRTDFRKADLWTYNERGRHSADYTVTITDSDF